MIRLGLVGCGEWGWRYIPSAVEAGNCLVTHVARVKSGLAGTDGGRTPRQAEVHAALSGCKTIDGGWQAMSGCPVDAVVVATPPDSHEEICEHFLSRGIPVMVEKPMALSIGAALAIREAASKTGTPLLVNHLHLFSSAYEVLRDEVLALSDRRFRIYARAGNLGPRRSYSALWDYGPHDVAMCLGLGLGNPTGVSCIRMPDDHHGAQRFDVNVRFGRHEASIQVWNGSLPKQRYFEVICEGVRLVYDELCLAHDELEPHSLVLRRNNVPLNVAAGRPLARAVHAFAEAVRTGVTDWRFGADIGIVTTRILHAADTGTVYS